MNETLQSFEIVKNYSALLNKLGKLAINFDFDVENITLTKNKFEISISENTVGSDVVPNEYMPVVEANIENSKYITDIWIGVILTLLIALIVFFICSCFLYHKFQQWKHTYQAGHLPDGHGAPLNEIYDLEIESLPSYTIVSGLPTYDDALEEFRKTGIILTPKSTLPIMKALETNSMENPRSADNSDCVCGTNSNTPYKNELTADQLRYVNQKRFSLQISFTPTNIRRHSRPRPDLLKQISRNNMLRNIDINNLSVLHRSTSAISLYYRDDLEQGVSHLQHHRGSLN